MNRLLHTSRQKCWTPKGFIANAETNAGAVRAGTRYRFEPETSFSLAG